MADKKYLDEHITIIVTEKFKDKLNSEYNFNLPVKDVDEYIRTYVCGKNTPSENYGIAKDSKFYQVQKKADADQDKFWRTETLPAVILQIVDYFDNPKNSEIDSNIADPKLKADGFQAKFRFLVKRDRQWADNRNLYFITFMLPDEIDMAKADERYRDPEAEAQLKQWE